MQFVLLCAKVKLPKFIWFKIIRLIPGEEYKYGHELVKNYSKMDIVRGCSAVGNFNLLPELSHHQFGEACLAAAEAGQLEFLNKLEKLQELNWSMVLLGAGLGGHLEIIKKAMEESLQHTHFAVTGAARGGHKFILEYLSEYTDWSVCHEEVWKTGNIDMIKYVRNKRLDLRVNLCCACASGKYEIVHWATQCAPYLYNCNYGAYKTGNNEIIKLVQQLEVNYHHGLLGAVSGGHMELVEKLVEKKKVEITSDIFIEAIRTNNFDIAEYLHANMNATELPVYTDNFHHEGLPFVLKMEKIIEIRWDRCFEYACTEGYIDLVIYSAQKAPQNLGLGLWNALRGNQITTAKKLIEMGATNMPIIKKICRCGLFSDAVMEFILK